MIMITSGDGRAAAWPQNIILQEGNLLSRGGSFQPPWRTAVIYSSAKLGTPFAARPSSSAKAPYLLDGPRICQDAVCSFCLSPRALGITCKLRPFPFVSISRVHSPDLCCAAPTVSQDHAVQLVNGKSSPATELADDSPADDYKSV